MSNSAAFLRSSCSGRVLLSSAPTTAKAGWSKRCKVAAGFVLHLKDGRTIYFSGDTAVFSDMQLIEKLYHPDLAFLPIGDFYTMGPREAALACRLLNAKKVIPMHFGTFPALTGHRAKLPPC